MSDQEFLSECNKLNEIFDQMPSNDLLELAKACGLDPLKDFAGGNLREVNICGESLKGANLSGADLSHANLSGTNLSHANLSGTNLSHANLSGADLSHANLSGADLSHSKLIRVDLTNADLTEAILASSNLTSIDLSRTNLSRADVSCSILNGADFIYSNLEGAAFNKSEINNSNFFSVRARNANFQGADLSGSGLVGADLIGSNLSYANLSNTNLEDANLRDANLTDTNFTDVKAKKARLGSNFGLSEHTKQELSRRKVIWLKGVEEVLLAWHRLTTEDRQWLLERGEQKEFFEKDILIEEGKTIDSIYILINGSLAVSINSRKLAEIPEGEVVGEISFIRKSEASATVKAQETSLVWSIPGDLLTEKIETDANFGCRFYHALSNILADRLAQSTRANNLVKEEQSNNFEANYLIAFMLINGVLPQEDVIESLIFEDKLRKSKKSFYKTSEEIA